LNLCGTYYQMMEKLLDKIQVYERREDRYLSAFRQYVNSAETILDAGCGSRAAAYIATAQPPIFP